MKRDEINEKLDEIEKSYKVKILYACESGSRAWGFESKDSDFDVRFIYVHDIKWYLKVDNFTQRDVIELPIDKDLDINGWELRKALNLLKKSNPALIEWINSPIVYRKDEKFHNELKSISKEFYSPKACFYHYSSMAKRNYREYLKQDMVRVKKYFYVLRPLLALRWIKQDLGIVPTEFDKLLVTIKDKKDLLNSINNLLEQKKLGFETKYMKQIPILNDFIEEQLSKFDEDKNIFKNMSTSTKKLDKFFLEYIG